MEIFKKDEKAFQDFLARIETMEANLSGCAREEDMDGLRRIAENFKVKTEDFYREDRKLHIGIVGQVKAGKSSFLNTLLFDGKEVLPKAATPKTATLTKMEYGEENAIQIEYYSLEEWDILQENALVDSDTEVFAAAREIVAMVRNNGFDPRPYLEKGNDRITFESYDDLQANLNEYVGADGKFTPIVRDVILYLNKEEFKDITIVDTPGLNDPIESRTHRTKEFMEVCDVVFFLSKAGRFLDKNDWTLLSTQLPQKGVKRLVLIASQFDKGIRDVLREKIDDDIFGEDDSFTDSVPKACEMLRKKFRKRAANQVEEFLKNPNLPGCTPEKAAVIRQCAEPIMVSSTACNMIGKRIEDFNSDEKSLYAALKPFADDMSEELGRLGGFEKVHELFDEVVRQKEEILEKKAREFIPTAEEEVKGYLHVNLEKTQKRIQILQDNDQERLLEEKAAMEGRMNSIKADLAALFGDLVARLEQEKGVGIRELRNASKDYVTLRERHGTKTHDGSYTTGILFWKKEHHYTYDEHYSYCIAADAIENLRKFSVEASNQVEKVIGETVQVKEIKRRLMDVVVNNFDLGDERFDASLFKIKVEETVSNMEFPIFHIDVSDAMNGIAGRFQGELVSAEKKTELSIALGNAISQIYGELCTRFETEIRNMKMDLMDMREKLETSILNDILDEFNELILQCKDKEKEIAGYRKYAAALESEIKKL